ncbi:hypothetical protein [Flagellimonas sp. CMM7]|uniref:hypothetical protein n=1 Tax=Flagellimonas sp. CMM7 TaxID=2654676 RepID=UPI0013D5B873|nr:hypothetical protein [Flagellimonas sp. CMM7]UII79623.1 hypothetical protein LV704_18425 [Flagellimonas sp. CMM7]
MESNVALWEIILKAITVLIAVIGFAYQIIGLDPQKRSRLKTDLEILEKFKKNGLEEEYERLSNHIKNRVPSIYRKPEETDTVLRIPDIQRLIIGVILTIFFSGITVYYYINLNGFQWWMVVTTLLVISGIGNILQGVLGDSSKK